MTKISSNIQLLNIIGKGAYGDVYMGINTKTKEHYAIKKITKKQLKSEIVYQYFNNEIFILKHLNHPNIIKFKGLNEYKSDYYLSTEYCNGGNLEDAMRYYHEKYSKPIPENIARFFIQNILKGIVYLNKNNLIHRDIKSDNILLNYDNEEDLVTHNFLKSKVKIIDFGFSRYLENDELAGSLVGTPIYMEPAILKTYMTSKNRVVEGFYDKKADMWSLGILTYELLIGIVPFVAKDIKGLFQSVKQRNFVIPKEEKRNFLLTKAAIQFIDKTLNIDMNMRPLPEELMKDKWIMGNFNNDDLYKMKNDEEIVLIDKKTRFVNFWKRAEKSPPKKNILEIVSLSYIDPNKISKNSHHKRGSRSKNNFTKYLNSTNNEYRRKILSQTPRNLMPEKNKNIKMKKKIEKLNDIEDGDPELKTFYSNKHTGKLNTISQTSVSRKIDTDHSKNSNVHHIKKITKKKLNSIKIHDDEISMKFANNTFSNYYSTNQKNNEKKNNKINVSKHLNKEKPKIIRVKVSQMYKVINNGNKTENIYNYKAKNTKNNDHNNADSEGSFREYNNGKNN